MLNGPAPYRHQAQVRFSDTDAMGHVNHARSLAYLEDARIAMLQQVVVEGKSLMSRGMILARLEIEYLQPIHLADVPVDVWVWVKHIGRSSFTLGYRIEQDTEVKARATTILVAYDYAGASSRLLSDDDRLSLEAFQARE
jgi:acyl-CoA thioester hydrolase